MLELQGFVNCDISVMTEDGRLTTTDFSINVNEAACSDGDISDDDDYDILNEKGNEGVLVNIPHTNKVLPLQYFDEKDFQFVSSYKKINIYDEILLNPPTVKIAGKELEVKLNPKEQSYRLKADRIVLFCFLS